MIILRLCDTPLFVGVFKPIDTTEKEICSRFSGVSNPPGKASAIDLVETLLFNNLENVKFKNRFLSCVV